MNNELQWEKDLAIINCHCQDKWQCHQCPNKGKDLKYCRTSIEESLARLAKTIKEKDERIRFLEHSDSDKEDYLNRLYNEVREYSSENVELANQLDKLQNELHSKVEYIHEIYQIMQDYKVQNSELKHKTEYTHEIYQALQYYKTRNSELENYIAAAGCAQGVQRKLVETVINKILEEMQQSCKWEIRTSDKENIETELVSLSTLKEITDNILKEYPENTSEGYNMIFGTATGKEEAK